MRALPNALVSALRAGHSVAPAIITVAPGQTRFLLAQPTPTGGAELLELSQEQGRKLVRRGGGERLWTPELETDY